MALDAQIAVRIQRHIGIEIGPVQLMATDAGQGLPIAGVKRLRPHRVRPLVGRRMALVADVGGTADQIQLIGRAMRLVAVRAIHALMRKELGAGLVGVVPLFEVAVEADRLLATGEELVDRRRVRVVTVHAGTIIAQVMGKRFVGHLPNVGVAARADRANIRDELERRAGRVARTALVIAERRMLVRHDQIRQIAAVRIVASEAVRVAEIGAFVHLRKRLIVVVTAEAQARHAIGQQRLLLGTMRLMAGHALARRNRGMDLGTGAKFRD